MGVWEWGARLPTDPDSHPFCHSLSHFAQGFYDGRVHHYPRPNHEGGGRLSVHPIQQADSICFRSLPPLFIRTKSSDLAWLLQHSPTLSFACSFAHSPSHSSTQLLILSSTGPPHPDEQIPDVAHTPLDSAERTLEPHQNPRISLMGFIRSPFSPQRVLPFLRF